MADGPGQTIQHRLLIFMDMAVGMGDAVLVHIGMVMLVMILVMMMLFSHGMPSFLSFPVL